MFSNMNEKLESLEKTLITPKVLGSICIGIVSSLLIAKYVSKSKKNNKKNSNQNYIDNNDHDISCASIGYDSLIPFTVKQKAKVSANEHFFASVDYERLPKEVVLRRSSDFFKFMNMRRSFRHYSKEPVDMKVIRNCIAVANTAPSGAHTSPWTFVVVQTLKKKMEIRKVVEAEEQINYERRMKKTWVDALEPVISNLHSTDNITKPYLSNAPYLIIVMKEMYRVDKKSGKKIDNYYPNQSTGIACGLLFAALHNANLVSLPSTPMGAEAAIRKICGRKQNEKVFLLVPVGYPAKEATVPFRTPQEWRKDMKKSMVIV